MLSSESSTKVNTTNTLAIVSSPTAVAKDYYIKVHHKRSGKTWRIPTPVSIGHDASNQLMVGGINTSYVVVVDPSERLHLIEQEKGIVNELKLLRFWGIRIKGPYINSVRQKRGLSLSFKELLADEERFITKKMTKSLSLLLGSWMGQSIRLAFWLLLILFSIQFYLTFIKAPDVNSIDRSNSPIRLTYNQLDSAVYGSQQDYQVFAKGITFQFMNLPTESLVLSFDVQGLDGEQELILEANSQVIYRSSVNSNCLQQWCEQRAMIDKELVEDNQLKLHFIHSTQFGDFKIRNLFLRKLRDLQPAEKSAILRWSNAAERYFREREYAPENLLLAHSENSKVLELSRTANGTEEFYNQAKVRNLDIESALSELRSTLWFSAQRNQQLANMNEARKDLQLLLRSLQPHDDRYSVVQEDLERIERMLQ